jgi:hypothetical protein
MGSNAASAEDRVERALLSSLLAENTSIWHSVDQLAREIGDQAATLRALDRLCATGLAESDRGLARASAAARRFDELGI